MKLGKVLHVKYYQLEETYLPYIFTVENSTDKSQVELFPNQIYTQFEDILYRNVILSSGNTFPVPYRYDSERGIDTPLVDEVLAMEKRSDFVPEEGEFLNQLRLYLNCLNAVPGIESVSYSEYMSKVFDPNCFTYVPEYLLEPIDLTGNEWITTSEEESQETTTQQEQEITQVADSTVDAGNEFVIIEGTDLNSEEYKLLTQYSVKTDTAPIPFIPKLKKYEKPIPYNVREMSLDEFKQYMYDISDVKSRVPEDATFIQDMVNILAVQNPETLDPETYISVFSSGRGCELLYEMLKYERLTESPNGLYDNMFYTVYLMQLACKDIQLDESEVEGTILYLLTYLCCNIRQLNITDLNEGDGIGALDDTGAANMSVTSELEMNLSESKIYNGLQSLNDLIIKCLRNKNLSYRSFLADMDDISAIKKLCISAKYNLCIYLESDIQRQLNLDVLNFTLGEFYTKLTFCGLDVAPSCVGEAIDNITKNNSETSDDYNYSKASNNPINSISYNSILNENKKIPDYCRLTGLARFKEIEDPRTLTFEIYKEIILSYDVNGKNVKEPYGLIVSTIDANGMSHYNLFPMYSSIYNELAMLGNVFHFQAKGEDHIIPLKVVHAYTTNDGVDMYALAPTLKDINTLNAQLREPIYLSRQINYNDRVDIFASLNLAISYLRRPRVGTNDRPLLLSLPVFLSKDTQHIEEVLRQC